MDVTNQLIAIELESLAETDKNSEFMTPIEIKIPK